MIYILHEWWNCLWYGWLRGKQRGKQSGVQLIDLNGGKKRVESGLVNEDGLGNKSRTRTAKNYMKFMRWIIHPPPLHVCSFLHAKTVKAWIFLGRKNLNAGEYLFIFENFKRLLKYSINNIYLKYYLFLWLLF